MENKDTINIDGFEIELNNPYLQDRIALVQSFNNCQKTDVAHSTGTFTVSTIKIPDSKMFRTTITAPDTKMHIIEYYLSMYNAEKAHWHHVNQTKTYGADWGKYEHYEKPK